MSKYQDIMNKIEVTDEMKSRILQNIETEMKTSEDKGQKDSAGGVGASQEKDPAGGTGDSGKIRKFDFARYMPMAAALAVFVLSTYLILNVIPHKQAATSTAPMSDSAMTYEATESAVATEAEMATESAVEEAAEAEMADEEAIVTEEAMPVENAVEEAAEAPMAAEEAIETDGAMPAETATQTPSDNAVLTGGVKTESATQTDGAKDVDATAPAVQAPANAGAPLETVAPAADTKPGFFARIARFFRRIFEAIKGWFK